MNLTISNESTEQIFGPLELNGDMTLRDLMALIQLDCGFDESKHDLYHNMTKLDLGVSRHLKEIFSTENDLILIRNKITEPQELSDDAFVENFRQEMLRNNVLRSQLISQIPGLDEMIQDPQAFKQRMGPLVLQRRYGFGGNGTHQQNPFGIADEEYRQLMSNPDEPSNQKRISELINQQEIDEQMRNALEYTPEVFTTVHMLFISLEINGHPVKAFVDTGAQATIMSTRLAERTGLTRLIDKRFIGEARGVGTSKILGRIHQAQVKIETQFIPCSFTVLDTHVDLLLGLDMLKRHQAFIDLKKDVLVIAGVQTSFLSESEIPKGITENMEASVAKDSVLEPPGQKLGSSSKKKDSETNSSFPEAVVKQLMDLGFSRKEVIESLRRAQGNTEVAASLLFQ